MTKNIGASVRQRLHNLAKDQNEDFQLTLTRFALQRLVFRLTQSPHHTRFVLKGATLFTLWSGDKYRATRDLDFAGTGESDILAIKNAFKDICEISSLEDGLVFQSETVSGNPIKEGEEYQGVRISMTAKLDQARIPIQVDIGFGDAITPAPEVVKFPNILGLSPASIRCYPRETVVAEKFHTMTVLGMANSRLKDFYDLWFLATNFPFQGAKLAKAIENTFERRQTKLPVVLPVALTKDFFEDVTKLRQWKAFLNKAQVKLAPESLQTVTSMIGAFVMPPVEDIASRTAFSQEWDAGGPWRFSSAHRPGSLTHSK